MHKKIIINYPGLQLNKGSYLCFSIVFYTAVLFNLQTMSMMMDMNSTGMTGMTHDHHMHHNSTGMDMGSGHDHGSGGMGHDMGDDMGHGMHMSMNGSDECGNGMAVSIKKLRGF